MFAAADRGFLRHDLHVPRSREPTDDPEAGKGAWSDYFYNNYLNNSFDNDKADIPDRPDVRRTLVGITDGTSNTWISFGEGNINTAQYLQTGNVALSTNVFDGGTLGTMRAGNPGQVSPGGVSLRRDSRRQSHGFNSWGGPWPQGASDGHVRRHRADVFPTSTPNLNACLPDPLRTAARWPSSPIDRIKPWGEVLRTPGIRPSRRIIPGLVISPPAY